MFRTVIEGDAARSVTRLLHIAGGREVEVRPAHIVDDR